MSTDTDTPPDHETDHESDEYADSLSDEERAAFERLSDRFNGDASEIFAELAQSPDTCDDKESNN